jgi:gas vesicle protein
MFMSTSNENRLNPNQSDLGSTSQAPRDQASESQGMSGVASEAQDALKQTAQDAMETAKEAAHDLAGQTQERASEMITQATEQTTQMVSDVKEQVTTSFTEQRDRAIGGLEALANVLREAGQNLGKAAKEASGGTQTPAMLGPIVEEAADRLAQSATFLRDKDMAGLLEEAQNLARKQPMLFMGAMFGIGVVGSRLLKGAPSGGNSQDGQNQSHSPNGHNGFNDTSSPANESGTTIPEGSQTGNLKPESVVGMADWTGTEQTGQPSDTASRSFGEARESMPVGRAGLGANFTPSSGSESER